MGKPAVPEEALSRFEKDGVSRFQGFKVSKFQSFKVSKWGEPGGEEMSFILGNREVAGCTPPLPIYWNLSVSENFEIIYGAQ